MRLHSWMPMPLLLLVLAAAAGGTVALLVDVVTDLGWSMSTHRGRV